MIGIYKISNNINERVYIGQSTNIFKRWEQHEVMLGREKHHSKKLQDFYLENNGCKLSYEILEECDKRSLNSMEEKHIDFYDAINNGFNMGYTSSRDVEIKNVDKNKKAREVYKNKKESRKSDTNNYLDNRIFVIDTSDKMFPPSNNKYKDTFKNIVLTCGEEINYTINMIGICNDFILTEHIESDIIHKIKEIKSLYSNSNFFKSNHAVMGIKIKNNKIKAGLLIHFMLINDTTNESLVIENFLDFKTAYNLEEEMKRVGYELQNVKINKNNLGVAMIETLHCFDFLSDDIGEYYE